MTPTRPRFRIAICRGPECGDRRGSAALHDQFVAALARHDLRAEAECTWQSCFGRCTQGPNVLVRELVDPRPGALVGHGFATLPTRAGITALYNHVDAERVERLVVDHVKNHQIVREFIERPGIHPLDPVGSRSKP